MHKFDRLGRDSIDALTIIYRQLKPKRVKVHSVMEPIDVWLPIGRMVVTNSFGVATYFSDNLATEITKGLGEKFERGGAIGPVSYGYDWQYQRDAKGEKLRNSAQLKPTADASTVVHIFQRYGTTNYTDLSLARELNTEGYTFCRRGRLEERVPFTADTVGGILTNRIYLGEVNYHGEWREGMHEPLIDRALFDQAQGIRAKRRYAGRHRKPTTEPTDNLLHEIAFCALCGARLHYTPCGDAPRRYGYYHCAGSRKQGTCEAKGVRVTVIDNLVLDLLQVLTIPPAIRDAAIALAQSQLGKSAQSSIDRSHVQTEVARLKFLFRKGHIGEAEYLREYAVLEPLILEPPPRQARVIDIERAAALLGDMPALLNTATFVQRRALVHQVIDTAWIYKAGVRAIRPAPAFRLLVSVLASEDAEKVTSTGLEPVAFSSGG